MPENWVRDSTEVNEAYKRKHWYADEDWVHGRQWWLNKAVPEQSVSAGAIHELNPQNRYFINPGAVGQPRDRDPRAAFGLFDLEALTFEFCRVEYDIDACAKKVMAAGLPRELAKRLSKGA